MQSYRRLRREEEESRKDLILSVESSKTLNSLGDDPVNESKEIVFKLLQQESKRHKSLSISSDTFATILVQNLEQMTSTPQITNLPHINCVISSSLVVCETRSESIDGLDEIDVIMFKIDEF
uniref:Uncharacterized protein n=1 Tax=Glossina brevipalpis TaxID=37001 RepID=A0A1A9WMW1_9MUSC